LAQPQPTPQPSNEATPVRDVLTALADELERARTLGLRVEGAICAIAVRAAIDSSVVAELQLRDFAGEVSRTCDGGFSVDVSSALDRVTLAEVRVRLAGQSDGDDDAGRWEML
jgi:hypothetical protein